MTQGTTSLDTRDTRDTTGMSTSGPGRDDAFVPRGAIAFFAAMIAFYVVFWFGLYALLVQRG